MDTQTQRLKLADRLGHRAKYYIVSSTQWSRRARFCVHLGYVVVLTNAFPTESSYSTSHDSFKVMARPPPHSARSIGCPQFPGVEFPGDRASTALKEILQPPVRRSRSIESFTKASVAQSEFIDPQTRRLSKEDKNGTATSSTATLKSSRQTPEEHRFERMMERFQLRRVSTMSGAPPVVTSHSTRLDSKKFSIATTTVAASAFVEVQDEGKDTETPLPEKNVVAKFRDRASTSMEELPQWIRLALSTTFPSVSMATRLRLVMLKITFVAKLLYTPFAIAYDDDEGWSTMFDTIVDSIFFLNILATCNTETTNAERNPITSRRAIWRFYRRNGFFADLLAALPLEHLLVIIPHTDVVHWVVGISKLALQQFSIHRHFRIFLAAWSKEAMASDKSPVAWMLFSRYSHLMRIIRIIIFIAVVAHYFACMWSWLHVDSDPDFFEPNDLLSIHMNSFYEALQLIQGQGMEAKTLSQTIFGSVAVLLGSVALAVMFGNVGVLVANFSASSTAYQRRMERVFAVMGKLELPHPIRERVHQYYEYLHTEYELLDGEIVKFAKDLSHTLTLETVLFRFMDVLVNVPHWHGCTPDFQKQLVLSLSVRIYLPDDFIMRRGEVGVECYLINRGTCKLCEYPTGNYETPTPPMMRNFMVSATNRQRTSGIRGSVASDSDGLEHGIYSRTRELTRGQAIGDFALIGNYTRSSDLRAVSYVEMCVIEREPFQRLLTRYPDDRKIIVESIVRHMMKSLEAQNLPCALMAMTQQVAPEASVEEAIQYVSHAMNREMGDLSIVFGVDSQFFRRLQRTVEKMKATAAHSARGEEDPTAALPSARVRATCPLSTAGEDPHNEIMGVVLEIQEILTRLERSNRVVSSREEGGRRSKNDAQCAHQPSTPRRRRCSCGSALYNP